MPEKQEPKINIPPVESGSQEEKESPERLADVIDVSNEFSEAFKKAHKRAVEKGLFAGSLENFRSLAIKQNNEIGQSIRKEDGKYREIIRKEIFALSPTFGVQEPSYLESLGPMELLRLRSLQRPQFLILGANNEESVREFCNISRKINTSASSNVADISPKLIPEFKDFQGEQGKQIIIADAMRMPYPDNSMDLICTNSLLNELMSEIKGGKIIKSIEKNITILFKEVYEKLKPGATFIMAEIVPDYFYGFRDSPALELESHLRIIAESVGFKEGGMFKGRSLRYLLRQDITGTEINEDGLTNYGNKPMMEDSERWLTMKFVK